MNSGVESFYLDYGPPGTLVKCPRLWRLALGLVMMFVAVVVPWIGSLNTRRSSMEPMDFFLLLGILASGGLGLVWQALRNELLHLRRVLFHPHGISIHWCHWPRLWGTRIDEKREVPWHDVASIAWREGTLEHDLKQHLILGLSPPLGRQQNHLTLLVCDHRDVAICEALLACLPSGVAAPPWLVSARLRRTALESE